MVKVKVNGEGESPKKSLKKSVYWGIFIKKSQKTSEIYPFM